MRKLHSLNTASVLFRCTVLNNSIYHAGYSYTDPFEPYFPKHKHKVVNSPKQLEKGDKSFLVLWGGEDIHPSIYKRPIEGSHVRGEGPSHRDAVEMALVEEATKLNMPIYGVCRGAQLLCALAGGVLIQDVSGHAGSPHLIEFVDGLQMPVSSLHHQMMYPWDVEHELLAWSNPRSTRYIGVSHEEETKIKVEPEIVWFPKLRGFGIQGHPEFMHPRHQTVKKAMKLFQDKAFV